MDGVWENFVHIHTVATRFSELLILLLDLILLYHGEWTLGSLWRMLAPSLMIGWWFGRYTNFIFPLLSLPAKVP